MVEGWGDDLGLATLGVSPAFKHTVTNSTHISYCNIPHHHLKIVSNVTHI